MKENLQSEQSGMRLVSNSAREAASFPRDFSFLVFAGTYTESTSPEGERSEGIYVYRMSPEDGALTLVQVMRKVINPSFLALHPGGQFLYAVNEAEQLNGQPGGGVSAFSIDPQTGMLTLLNQQLSQGGNPCYLCADATGQVVLAANYSSGSISVLPVDADGKLRPATDVILHQGSGLDPLRQAGPHVHSITLDRDNRFAIAADLGLDKLVLYRLDLVVGRLIPHTSPWVQVKAGAGPRHLDFHPNGRFVYLINELNSSLTVYAYDAMDGVLREIQTVPTLPEGYRGTNWPADVHVAPSGKFVYASNRGHDSIVIYAVDEENGALVHAGHESTMGKNPRNFAFDPTGAFLLVANQGSGTIVTFRIDSQTGKLSPTGEVTKVPMPVCIKIICGRL